MALNIEGASYGYDSNNLQQLKQRINVNCVSDTIANIRTGLNALNTAVTNAWVGTSADRFKEKMQADADAVSKFIQEAGDLCLAGLDGVGAGIKEVDESISF